MEPLAPLGIEEQIYAVADLQVLPDLRGKSERILIRRFLASGVLKLASSPADKCIPGSRCLLRILHPYRVLHSEVLPLFL